MLKNKKKQIQELESRIKSLESENKYLSKSLDLFQSANINISSVFFQINLIEDEFILSFLNGNVSKIFEKNKHDLLNNSNSFFDSFEKEYRDVLYKNLKGSKDIDDIIKIKSGKEKKSVRIFIKKSKEDSNCWNGLIIDMRKQIEIINQKANNYNILEDIINSSDDYIWSVDNSLKLTTVNNNYFRIYKNQYNVELKPGINIISNLPQSIQQLWINRYKRALNGERYMIEEFTYSGNKASFIEMYFNPIYNHNEIIGVSIFARDITQKKQVEIELDSLASLPAENPDPVFRVFKDGTIINSNLSGEELLKNWGTKVGGILPDNMVIDITNVLSSGNRIEIEEYLNGITYSISFTPVQEKEYVNIYARDISSKKEAELALRESEERLRAIFSAANNVSFILTDASDPDPIIIDFSPGAENLFNYSKYEILGKPISLLLPDEELKWLPEINRKMRSGKAGYKGEINNIRKNGEVFPVNFSTYPLFDSNGDMYASLLVSLDISELKEFERTMINAIIDTEEKERERFASDLHDGLGPLLSSVKLYLKVLSKSIVKGKENIIEDAFEVVDESIKSIKIISNNFSPHILNDFGLYAAINAFVKKVNIPDDLKLSFDSNVKNQRFDKNIEIIIYRISKELINNTLKHASADKIDIKMNQQDNQLILEYKDNGVGFDKKKILSKESQGLGLYSIRNRIKSIKGEINIQTKLGKGVKFIVKVKI